MKRRKKEKRPKHLFFCLFPSKQSLWTFMNYQVLYNCRIMWFVRSTKLILIGQVIQMHTFGYLLVFVVPSVLAVMNLMWFGKIIKGLIKQLAKMQWWIYIYVPIESKVLPLRWVCACAFFYFAHCINDKRPRGVKKEIETGGILVATTVVNGSKVCLLLNYKGNPI